jgi:ferredoxin
MISPLVKCLLTAHTPAALRNGKNEISPTIVPSGILKPVFSAAIALMYAHSVIRAKFYHDSNLENAPEGFKSAPINSRGFPETQYSLQVYVEDCTGCTLCVEVCPAHHALDRSLKAINMGEKEPIPESRKTEHKIL